MLDFFKGLANALKGWVKAQPKAVRVPLLALSLPLIIATVAAVVVMAIISMMAFVTASVAVTVFGGMFAPGTMYSLTGPAGQKGYLMGTWHLWVPTPWRALYLLRKVNGRLATEVTMTELRTWLEDGGKSIIVNDADLRASVMVAASHHEDFMARVMSLLPKSLVGMESVLEAFANDSTSLECPVVQASLSQHLSGVRNSEEAHYRTARWGYVVGVLREMFGVLYGFECPIVNNSPYFADKDVSAEFILRNGMQAAAIIDFLKDEEGLCAVGAAHLKGDGNVLHCLISQGWEVKKI